MFKATRLEELAVELYDVGIIDMFKGINGSNPMSLSGASTSKLWLKAYDNPPTGGEDSTHGTLRVYAGGDSTNEDNWEALTPATFADHILVVAGTHQPLDADLTSWAAVTRASGFDTFTATPSSANLASLVTDETGSGALVFGTAPTFPTTITVGAASGATGQILLKGTTSGTVTLKTADAAGTYTLTLPTDDGTADQVLKTDGSGVLSWTSATGTPTVITVANEASDTTCFPLFVTAATGDLGPKTNTSLAFNSSTGVLTLTAPVLGTPTSGTLTNCTGLPTILAADEASDTTCFPVFFTAATGELGPKTNAGLTFNSSTGLLGATSLQAGSSGTIGLSTDVLLARDAANTLAQRNSTNAQTFSIYNTADGSPGSNYERGNLFWSSNVFRLTSAAAGTGTLRDLYIVAGGSNLRLACANSSSAGWVITNPGHFTAISDNTLDIGASASGRPRDLFLGRNATFGGYQRGSVDTRTGAGAISITAGSTKLVTTGADALTLADGVEGQFKYIVMITDGGDGTLTPTNLGAGTTITFDAVGDAVLLQFLGTDWWVIANYNCTIA